MVGLLTFPLSLLADRWGRVRSLTAMAILWSLATLLCAVADNYEQMLAGRLARRRRRSGLWQRRHRRRGQRLSEAPAGDAFGRVHGRRTCSARCWASALAARSPRPMAGEWRSSPSRCPACCLASSIRSWSANGGSASPPSAGRSTAAYERRQAFPKLEQPVRGPDAQMRLCRQRAAAVRRGRPAGLAADLFQPLL